MKVQSRKGTLTEVEMQQLLRRHDIELRRKVMLKNYYNGKHDILRKRGRTNAEVNNRLVSNYPAYISNISTGFFIGQPVSYKTARENQQQLDTLLEVYKYNDEQAHNLELAEEASITGEAYEFLYLDGEAAIRLATVPSEEVILVTDATLEENILYALRHYRIYDYSGTSYEEYLDVYDKSAVKRYAVNGGSLRLVNTEAHYFDEVPVIEYPNNRQHKGDFEDVISLVDAYNLAQSLTLDDLSDFTDAFLVLKNNHILKEEDARELRRRKIIEVDEGGGAEWLIKNVNDTYVENIKTRLQSDIHKFASVPDLSDEAFAANASGVAIKYKLIGLEQIRSRKEREFKKALQRRIELISGILKLKGLPEVDFRSIEIQFTANIPANVQEQAAIVQSLDGIVSQKTLLSLLPFVTDAVAELKELEDEQVSSDDDSAFYDRGGTVLDDGQS